MVKNVISAEKAAGYVDRMYQWMESFGRGFKRDDQSTWRIDNVPNFNRGGLYNRKLFSLLDVGVIHVQVLIVQATVRVRNSLPGIFGPNPH